MGESDKSRPPQVCSRTEVSIYLPAPIPLPLEATPPLPYLTLSWVQAPVSIPNPDSSSLSSVAGIMPTTPAGSPSEVHSKKGRDGNLVLKSAR